MTANHSPSDASRSETLTGDISLAAIAMGDDAHAAILDRYHLDFCCRGRRTLAEACTAAGIDLERVLTDLRMAGAARSASTERLHDWQTSPVPALVGHIVDGHHAYTRDALARLDPLVQKVLARHRNQHPELARVASAFFELAAELEPHMAREELLLFPYIRALASLGERAERPRFVTVRNPIRMMMMQHDRAAELLAEIQEASDGLVTPDGACTSYAVLYAGLGALRLDLLKHVSLENNVLFPRAIALEDALLQSPRPPAPGSTPEG